MYINKCDWYLAQCKPNAVRIAQDNLKRQGFGTFLPMIRETRRSAKTFASSLKPLFGGYIFVSDTPEISSLHKVRSTRGVTKLVSFGRAPQPVNPALIAELRARQDEEGAVKPVDIVSPGETVTVTQGPFAEIVATVLKLAPDQRVWVLLDFMGRQNKVSLDSRHIRRA